MAVYKIFPYKDSTLYSLYPNSNFGLDAMSEVNNSVGVSGTPDVARFLTQFDSNEIQDIIENKISGSTWDVNFRAFIATAQGISTQQTLELYPIAQTWNNGTGEFGDSPTTTNGVTWVDASSYGVDPWVLSGSVSGEPITGSYNPTYSTAGGGNWFYSGSIPGFIIDGYVEDGYVELSTGANLYTVTQSFNLRSDKDINVGVKPIVDQWNSGSIPNNGFIVKFNSSIEFSTSASVQPIMQFYSVDTNTIYPPCLEFRWRDYSTVLTGSAVSSIVNTVDLKMSLAENPGEFFPESVNKFYINVSPLYPTRTYQTSSLFTNLNYLPTSSYYAIKDLATNEFVVNFDTLYTQISSDANGNYFTATLARLFSAARLDHWRSRKSSDRPVQF